MEAATNCQVVFGQNSAIAGESRTADSTYPVIIGVLVDHAAREVGKLLDLGVDVGVQQGVMKRLPFWRSGMVPAASC